MSVSRDLKTAKPIKYEEALEECLRYFQGERMQAEIFLDKYAVRNKDNELLESNPDDMHRRLASEFARVDNKKYKNTERKPLSFDEVYESLKNYERVLPAGSPTTTLGNPFMISSASNCFVTATQDSYGGICRTDQEFVQICKRRGGIGTDVSSIRPAGLSVSNAAKTTSGLIPFVRRFSNSIEEVGQNGRRGASMISCSIHHPQVMDFIKSKVEGDISGANISVRLSDEFMNAVDKGTEYQQRWPVDAKPGEEVVSKFINAREIWREINECAHSCGDPGLLLWDNIIKESPADCYSDVGFETISTNPCGELPLSNKDSCRLLCLIVVNYVRNPYTSEAYFDYEAFEKDSRFIQRLADGLIDLEQECVDRIINKIKSDPQDEETKRTEMRIWKDVKETLLNGRRTGTGVTAIGDAIAALGIKYGTDESIEEIGKIYRTLKLGCYRESVEAAKILGPFKAWNFEKEKKNPFLLRIKDEDPKLYKDMKKYGRRNIGLLTTAPTGTISLFASTEFEGKRYFGTASGIENVF
jgi:ribonucleoside-diphosphate reductase alpha chain